MKHPLHTQPDPWTYPVAFIFAVIFFAITGTRMLAWLLMKLYEVFISGNF